jgi:hypothetical protein
MKKKSTAVKKTAKKPVRKLGKTLDAIINEQNTEGTPFGTPLEDNRVELSAPEGEVCPGCGKVHPKISDEEKEKFKEIYMGEKGQSAFENVLEELDKLDHISGIDVMRIIENESTKAELTEKQKQYLSYSVGRKFEEVLRENTILNRILGNASRQSIISTGIAEA